MYRQAERQQLLYCILNASECKWRSLGYAYNLQTGLVLGWHSLCFSNSSSPQNNGKNSWRLIYSTNNLDPSSHSHCFHEWDQLVGQKKLRRQSGILIIFLLAWYRLLGALVKPNIFIVLPHFNWFIISSGRSSRRGGVGVLVCVVFGGSWFRVTFGRCVLCGGFNGFCSLDGIRPDIPPLFNWSSLLPAKVAFWWFQFLFAVI